MDVLVRRVGVLEGHEGAIAAVLEQHAEGRFDQLGSISLLHVPSIGVSRVRCLSRRHDGASDTVGWGRVRRHRMRRMVRPGSWTRPTGVRPVRVIAGEPGSRPQSAGENPTAERGVKSLFGGSKNAGRSFTRILQPRQSNNGGAEPLMSRRRPSPAGPGPDFGLLSPSGVRGAARFQGLVWNRRDPSAHALSGRRPVV